jgi:hypothetical protein
LTFWRILLWRKKWKMGLKKAEGKIERKRKEEEVA